MLKPGGRYVILEFSRPAFAPWRGVYHVYLRHAIPAIGGRADRRPRRASSTSTTRSAASRRSPSWPPSCARAGFSTISWKDLTGGIVALHTAVK